MEESNISVQHFCHQASFMEWSDTFTIGCLCKFEDVISYLNKLLKLKHL